jgi:hypothetical protein
VLSEEEKMKTLSTILFLGLGAASASAQGNISSAAPDAACGPLAMQFEVKMDSGATRGVRAVDGKALVYVVEDQQFKFAKDVTTRVGLDGVWVGANRGDSYFAFLVDPGEHHLCADWVPGIGSGRLVSLAVLTAEAGKVYYFRARTTGARYEKAALDLQHVNDDEGRLLASTVPLSISNPKGKK